MERRHDLLRSIGTRGDAVEGAGGNMGRGHTSGCGVVGSLAFDAGDNLALDAEFLSRTFSY